MFCKTQKKILKRKIKNKLYAIDQRIRVEKNIRQEF